MEEVSVEVKCNFRFSFNFFSVIGVKMQAKITLQAVWAFFTSSCRWLFATFLFVLNGLVIFFWFWFKTILRITIKVASTCARAEPNRQEK